MIPIQKLSISKDRKIMSILQRHGLALFRRSWLYTSSKCLEFKHKFKKAIGAIQLFIYVYHLCERGFLVNIVWYILFYLWIVLNITVLDTLIILMLSFHSDNSFVSMHSSPVLFFYIWKLNSGILILLWKRVY